MKTRVMYCMCCEAMHEFVGLGVGIGDPPREDHACMHCGWLQVSAPGGARELCDSATWHSVEAYEQMRDFARTEFNDVADAPNCFRE